MIRCQTKQTSDPTSKGSQSFISSVGRTCENSKEKKKTYGERGSHTPGWPGDDHGHRNGNPSQCRRLEPVPRLLFPNHQQRAQDRAQRNIQAHV